MTELVVGNIVVSKAGHDEGRMYAVTAVLGDGFVLVSDGNYRRLENPKTKREKHLSYRQDCAEIREKIENKKLCDADLINQLKKLTGGESNA